MIKEIWEKLQIENWVFIPEVNNLGAENKLAEKGNPCLA